MKILTNHLSTADEGTATVNDQINGNQKWYNNLLGIYQSTTVVFRLMLENIWSADVYKVAHKERIEEVLL
jgi:hypothetical protein